jgi:predicted transcriptional regulator
MYFTKKEEEFTALLIDLGMHRNVAKVLVYLAGAGEATSRTIDRGIDLREPEVSLAISQLAERGWVSSREIRGENRGRPVKIYQLALPVTEIISNIEHEKRIEVTNTLNLIKKFRESVA